MRRKRTKAPPYVLGVAGGASPEEQRSRAALAEFLTDEIGHELTKLLRARSGAGASKGPRLLYGSTCPEWLYLLPRVARGLQPGSGGGGLGLPECKRRPRWR